MGKGNPSFEKISGQECSFYKYVIFVSLGAEKGQC